MQFTSLIIGQLRELISQEIPFIFLTIFLLTEIKHRSESESNRKILNDLSRL